MPLVPPVSAIGSSQSLLACLEDALSLVGFGFFEGDPKLAPLHAEFRELGRRKAVLEKYRMANERTLDAIISGALKGFDEVVFMTGVSPDRAGRGMPRKYGVDILADIHAVSSILQKEATEDFAPFEDILFFPVAPVLLPAVFSLDASISAALPDILQDISEEMERKGKRPFGSLTKSLDRRGNVVNYFFRESLFDREKRIYDIERSPEVYAQYLDAFHTPDGMRKRAGLETAYNKALLVPVYEAVARALAKDAIHLYALKGSYVTSIMEEVSEKTHIPLHLIGGKSGPLPKGKITSLAEADPSCISALTGFLRARWAHQEKVQPTRVPRQKAKTGISLDFKNCPYEEFIGCSHQDKCDEYRDPCAMTHYRKQAEGIQTLIRKDMKEHRVRVNEGIEGIVALLQTQDFPAFSFDGRNYSWANERGLITPLTIPASMREREGRVIGDLRASSLGAHCALAPIISLYGDAARAAYREATGKDLVKNNLAVIGTGVHALLLGQHENGGVPAEFAPNNIWRKLGRDVVFRSAYCEQFVTTTIAGVQVTGHIDAAVHVGGRLEDGVAVPGKDIGIIDIKRSRRLPNPQWGYRYQLLTYALAADEATGGEAERYILMLVNRAFDKPVEQSHILHEGFYKPQEITILVVEKNDPLIGALQRQAAAMHEDVTRLLNDNAYLAIRKQEKADEGECDSCEKNLPDQKEMCDFLAQNAGSYRNLREMLGKG